MNTAIDNFGLHKTLKRGLQFMVHTMDTLPDEFLKKIKNFYAKPLQEKKRFISEPYPKDGKGQAAVFGFCFVILVYGEGMLNLPMTVFQ